MRNLLNAARGIVTTVRYLLLTAIILSWAVALVIIGRNVLYSGVTLTAFIVYTIITFTFGVLAQHVFLTEPEEVDSEN